VQNPQIGMMKAWSSMDWDNGCDEWWQEIHLSEQDIGAFSKLNPKPKFFVYCGNLIHTMPGIPWW
ncbi:hypothetical protein ACQP3C_29870, partial [Escherichia coli]